MRGGRVQAGGASGAHSRGTEAFSVTWWALLRAEITTGLDTTDDAGRERPVQKAKMEIIMVKTLQFDSLMEASSSGQQQQQGGSSDSPEPPAGPPPDAPPDASSAPPSASQVPCNPPCPPSHRILHDWDTCVHHY